MSSPKITIDIVSDVVCPWCLIGYKRLKRALMDYPKLKFELRWQPFELNPDMPDEGQDLYEHIGEKYGKSRSEVDDSRQLLKAVGLSVGADIHHFENARVVNTFRAHQLMHWAGLNGKATELALVLFEAYFSNGRDVNDIDVLKKAAAKVGLDAWEAGTLLEDGRYKLDVRKRQAMWLQRGVQAVPAYIFGDNFGLSGAREPGEIKAVIDQLLTSGNLVPTVEGPRAQGE